MSQEKGKGLLDRYLEIPVQRTKFEQWRIFILVFKDNVLGFTVRPSFTLFNIYRQVFIVKVINHWS